MAKALRAKHNDGLWEIYEIGTGRWWTSTGSGDDAFINNEKLRNVKPDSALGKKIRQAVAAAKGA